MTGDVKILSANGKEHTPVKGDSFNTGDTILTGASGTAQIRMNDGGLMAIRANTQLKLDQYIFNRKRQADRQPESGRLHTGQRRDPGDPAENPGIL